MTRLGTSVEVDTKEKVRPPLGITDVMPYIY
jgi:hypothetical protein